MGRWVIVGILVAALSVGPGLAQTKRSIETLRVTANLNSDGTVKVTQELTYALPTALSWQLFSNSRDLSVRADGQELNSRLYQLRRQTGATRITAAQAAKSWQVHYTTTTTLIRHNDRDQAFMKIFQQPGGTVNNISVTLTLPETVTESGLTGNVYAINGVVSPTTALVSNRQINYSARFASNEGLFTINASWPKSVLQLTRSEELRLTLLNLEILPWLLLGIVLPLLCFLILLQLLLRQRLSERRVREISPTPPSALAPMLVGVLVNKKIYPAEIVALLVDLCQRGYIVIVKKGRRYYLSQRKVVDSNLQSWEQKFVEQLFPTPTVVTENTLQLLSKQSLFSPKIRDAFAEIYQVITEMSFFAENPHHTRVRYKLVALFLYFLGAFSLLWTAISNLSPYLLIPLAGTMAMAFLIIRLTPKLIRYTDTGRAQRTAWLKFANYLAADQPLPLEATRNQLFEKYLPYAIALNRTEQWARRFDRSNTVIIKPDWFITYQESSTAEFVTELTTFTRAISESLASLRGPLVN